MTNPFAPQQPTQPAPAAPAANNPFAPAAPAPTAQAPATAPAWLAQPAAPASAPAQTLPYQGTPAPAAAAPPALDPQGFRSAGAPPPSGAKGAKLAHMYGRLVMIFPLSRTQRPKKAEYITPEQHAAGNTTQDTVTATVVVLDAGQGRMDPITFGGDPAKFPPVPDTESAPLPYVRKAMWITQTQIIAQIEADLPSSPGARPGIVIGRLAKGGPAHNDPWYLLTATPDDESLARTYLELVANGTYPHPLA